MSLESAAAAIASKGKRIGIGGSIRERMKKRGKAPAPKKPPYEGRARIGIPHGKRSDKMESKAGKIGAKANKAYEAGKLKKSGKLATKAQKFHAKADKASSKYQAKQAKKAPVSSISA